jgi:hypothetical protein
MKHRADIPPRIPDSEESTMMTTWLDPEARAYPHGGFTRRGRAILCENEHNPITLPYGEVRAVRVSIPDTFFSVPARLRFKGTTVKGFMTRDRIGISDEYAYYFVPEADPSRCIACGENEGCKYDR